MSNGKPLEFCSVTREAYEIFDQHGDCVGTARCRTIAKLFSAAPEMLEALEAAEHFERLDILIQLSQIGELPDGMDKPTFDEYHDAHVMATLARESVLKKIRGEK